MQYPFTHLHLHTEYSLGDGVCNVKSLVKKAKAFGYSHVAITDHGTMAGCVKFYEECKNHGVKPIIGLEAYYCNNMHEKKSDNNRTHHLILLAKNNKGYDNLKTLVTLSHEEGFYAKPRIDFDLLSKHSEGLIATSTCIVGKIPSLIRFDSDGSGIQQAYEEAQRFKDLFGDDYYLEYQYQGAAIDENSISESTRNLMKDQMKVIQVLDDMSVRLGIKKIIASDVHYIEPNDYYIRWMKMKIKTGYGSKKEGQMSDEFGGALAEDSLNYSFTSPEYMYSMWGHIYPDALVNAYEVGEKCEVDIPLITLGQKPETNLPNLDLPMEGVNLGKSKSPEEAFLKSYVLKRFQEEGMLDKPEYVKRLKKEFAVFGAGSNFCKGVLVLWDTIRFAETQNIWVGAGRGSAAASLVLYLLGITQIDPILHDLDFDRFLSADEIPHTNKSRYCSNV